jgi:serine/threonine protein kinase
VDEKVVTDSRVSNVGFYGPCYKDETLNQIYGVLPFIAPEVLRGKPFSVASDIYSFGIIMNTFTTGKRPWYNRAHDIRLAKDICDDTPSFYAELMG